MLSPWQTLGLEQRGAQLGAMPAGMEPQAQAGDRNPGEREKIMDAFKHALLL